MTDTHSIVMIKKFIELEHG